MAEKPELTLEQALLPTTVHVRAASTSDDALQKIPASTTDAVSILLDPNEHELFDIIIQVASAFRKGEIDLEEWQANPQQRPAEVVVRVAGGWVRDKLIQDYGGAYDVDLAVQNMTGVQLATLIQMYVKKNCNPANGQASCSRMGVIAANPAQSKHLETATFRLCGVDMDLSNLRAHEIYTEDSRIPVVRLGTPLEDALRRDFTVNALFYNLHLQTVEDWTGRAVRDLLQEKVLVTPLEPVQTFRDDPLRVLRAVRFAVRLDLAMDKALREAARLPEIRQALNAKVSRERFGKELEGMLSGKKAKPLVALTTIIDLGLAPIVFALPDPTMNKRIGNIQGHTVLGTEDYFSGNYDQIERSWNESKHLLSVALPLWNRYRTIAGPSHAADDRLLPLTIALSPFRKLRYCETKKPDRWHCLTGYIVAESIKFKKSDVAAVTLVLDHVDAMVGLLESTDKVTRLDAGMPLRSLREYWSTTLLLAAILQSRQESTVDWMAQTERLYRKIVSDYDLDQCWKMKPLLDGKILQKAFGKGPIIGVYMQEQVRWMLTNRNGSAEECLEYLKQVQVREPAFPREGPERKKAHIS